MNSRLCRNSGHGLFYDELLVVSIYFQAKGEEGYGEWVWASKLGKVAAICHKNYDANQAYLALAVRFIGHSNCDSFSDSDPLVKPFSSDSVSLAQTLTSKVCYLKIHVFLICSNEMEFSGQFYFNLR
ncbi:unnamed protein product [Gongylonema pulchrum]|uniref:AP2/ERF domain-containing protein n=1 Tax=Gongylonema pulchrum TaxID=637853 RepID=A0A183E272_9BILA|nr:unnamed protein product [Gongylonema pulchrum]